MESRRLCESTSPLREHGGFPHPMCTGFFFSGCVGVADDERFVIRTLKPCYRCKREKQGFFCNCFFLFGDFFKLFFSHFQ